MYNIVVYAPELTVDGFISMIPTSGWRPETSRRITKTSTLDGGVYLNDLGFSTADADFNFRIPNPVVADIDNLDILHQNFAILRLVTETGTYEGSVSQLRKASEVTFKFTVSQKIS